MLGSLHAERDRITTVIADLEEARRRLDEVIELTEHPDPAACARAHDAAGRTASILETVA
jgi:ribosomal protein L12E/L44/L45/RPP1/RPP2